MSREKFLNLDGRLSPRTRLAGLGRIISRNTLYTYFHFGSLHGVGKTTTTANIGLSLAHFSVVAINTDVGLRNLNHLGLENRVNYTASKSSTATAASTRLSFATSGGPNSPE
ncbi:hypothetical protein KSP40_PGU006949 [Platanthera guangdongensis]|uniref:Uncharacterized protein n=1 Tax=Platanthera guangdongensis TaxID=2320717 RepID=A0ABR2N4F3_9ASPA